MTDIQLPLLPPPPDTASELRLPERTRRLGLSQVAKARALLDRAALERAELDETVSGERDAAHQLAALRHALRTGPSRAAA